jgi:hypothetical protein
MFGMTALTRRWPLALLLLGALVAIGAATSLRAVAACTLTATFIWFAA